MGQGEENHFLAGYRADVMVHGHDLDKALTSKERPIVFAP